MKLYHIVAKSSTGVIGKDGHLPWHHSADLKLFKATTMGGTLIMGRKTFESIGGKPLPGRENFVLSRSDLNVPDGVRVFHSLEDALKAASRDRVFIMGGANVFKQSIHQIDGIYLTQVQGTYKGDAYYPEIPPSFTVVERKKSPDNPQLEFLYLENSSKR
ncbi:MAG: hypothetical protein A3A73_00665 [Omnitrophica bacterium RIFCSPLOWO2_01_FULL_50_24]|nr:MAG: hypothetical protein A3A73_00665 [Omnitrophica bacterium RIFCSPLOWO2_01_FULL_50_24]